MAAPNGGSCIFIETGGSEDGTYTWADASVEVEINGSGSPDTWVFSDQFTGSTATAYEAMEDLLSWLNGSLRPWYGTATWTRYYAGTSPSNSVGVYFVASGASFDWTCDADFEGCTGIDSDTNQTLLGTQGHTDHYLAGGVQAVKQGALSGTVGGTFYVSGQLRSPDQSGYGGRGVAYTPQNMVSSPRPVSIDVVLDYGGTTRLAAATNGASNPRRAYVYRADTDTWVHVALAPAGVRRVGRLQWSWSPDAWEIA